MSRTAVVITDPQNDFLSEKGVTWGVVGKSVVKNNTVANRDFLACFAPWRENTCVQCSDFQPLEQHTNFQAIVVE